MAQDSYRQMPEILAETSKGVDRYRIVDAMLVDREIECVDEVDAAMANALCLQLRYLQKLDPGAEITIVVNSPGGSVSDGLAIVDVMNAISCPIRTICLGMAASMGALIFMSGTKGRRQMLPHSQVMIHNPLVTGGVGGSALSVKSRSDSLMRTRQITGEIISACTGKSLEEVFAVTANDAYFEAAEAVKWGLADEVVEEL